MQRAFMNRRRAIQNLQNNTFDYRYLVCLVFSHEDEDLVRNHFLPSLEQTLFEQTQTRPDIAIGDDNFRPGFGILNEITRCITDSAVMIAVVSNNFCNSRFCNHEIERAVDLKTPVILAMKERVNEELMTPVLRALFRSTVRVQIINNDNGFALIPTMDNLVTTVLDHVD